MKNLYKFFLTTVMALFAMVVNAEVTTVYTWDGNGKTKAEDATISGGTATAKGGDASTVAGSKQKNNWCFKLGKTYMAKVDNVDTPTHYVEIELTTPLKGGETILVNTFINDGAKSATFGLNFNGDNELTYEVEDVITENGVPTTNKEFSVPASAANCTKIRIYRKMGGTAVYVSKLVITSNGTTPAATTFAISDNGDGTAKVTPTPATARWAAFAYPENDRASFLSVFGLDENLTDAAVLSQLIQMQVPVEMSTGESYFDVVDFMDNFGGADNGNYVVAVAECDEEGYVIGNTTTKTIAVNVPDLELEMNYAESDTYPSDVDMLFQNEEWYARFDVKEVPVVAGKTYTIDDLDLTYSYVKKKDAELTQNWTKYSYKSVTFSLDENGNMDALVTVEDAEHNEMTISMYYETNDQKSITVSGTYEVVNGNVAVTALNKAGDYRLNLGIKASDLENFKEYGTDDLTSVGCSIQTPWDKDAEKIVAADIFAMKVGEAFNLMGSVTGEYEVSGEMKTRVYNINITLTKPESGSQEIDFGSVLLVSEDEGDIKLTAENEDGRFVGYISVNPLTTDVPAGEYDLLAYSKFGEYSADIQQYMMDVMKNGKVVVTNTDGVVALTATFTQGSKEWTVKASVMPLAVSGLSLTTEKDQGLDSDGDYTVVFNHTFAVKDPSKIDATGYTYVAAYWDVYDVETNQKVTSSSSEVKYNESSSNIYISGLEAGKEYIIKMVELSGSCMNMSTLEETSLIYLDSGLPSLTFTVAGSAGINNATINTAKTSVRKFIEKGKVVIEKNGKKIGVDAVEIK